jgi:hypothetical protein
MAEVFTIMHEGLCSFGMSHARACSVWSVATHKKTADEAAALEANAKIERGGYPTSLKEHRRCEAGRLRDRNRIHAGACCCQVIGR